MLNIRDNPVVEIEEEENRSPDKTCVSIVSASSVGSLTGMMASLFVKESVLGPVCSMGVGGGVGCITSSLAICAYSFFSQSCKSKTENNSKEPLELGEDSHLKQDSTEEPKLIWIENPYFKK